MIVQYVSSPFNWRKSVEERCLGCDVVIVGLGPTGSVLANMLGKQGWLVVGIERDEDIYYAPRAVHFDDEIMRIFQSMGLSDAISRTSEPFSEMEFLGRARGKPLLRSKVGSQDQRYGHAGAWWFHQPTLERHFQNGLKRFPNVTALHGLEATAIETNAEGVRVRGVRTDGSEIEVSARYLIGCDGGRSLIRKAARLQLNSFEFDEAWVVVDTKTRSGGKDPKLPAVHQQVCNPRQPVTYVPMAGPYYEWQFMVVDGKSEREATDPAFVRKQLREFVDLGTIEITRIAYYRFHALWARKWREGRIILAGNSAHQMPPFLGQGMCSGIRDAQSLAWRLDLVLSRNADEVILDDYQTERSEHVGHLIQGAIFLGHIIQTRRRWIARLRNGLLFWPARTFSIFNEQLIRTANRKQPISTGFIGSNARQLAGRLSIQPKISFRAKDMLLDDALGCGFAVIARAGALQGHQAILERLKREYRVVAFEIGNSRSRDCLVDIEGKLAAWFDENRVDFVLLRPDRYVFDGGRVGELATIVSDFQRKFASPRSNLAAAA